MKHFVFSCMQTICYIKHINNLIEHVITMKVSNSLCIAGSLIPHSLTCPLLTALLVHSYCSFFCFVFSIFNVWYFLVVTRDQDSNAMFLLYIWRENKNHSVNGYEAQSWQNYWNLQKRPQNRFVPRTLFFHISDIALHGSFKNLTTSEVFIFRVSGRHHPTSCTSEAALSKSTRNTSLEKL